MAALGGDDDDHVNFDDDDNDDDVDDDDNDDDVDIVFVVDLRLLVPR